jgi:hypothetical protein
VINTNLLTLAAGAHQHWSGGDHFERRIDLSVGTQVSLINVILAVMLQNAGDDRAAVIPALIVTWLRRWRWAS